jgi:hypothetical protein
MHQLRSAAVFGTQRVRTRLSRLRATLPAGIWMVWLAASVLVVVAGRRWL